MAISSDYILLRAYADAERWLQRATEFRPDATKAWYLLGQTQYNLGHDGNALNSFNQCLSRSSQDARCEYNKGLVYERLQEPELAREAYTTAIQWNEQRNVIDPQPYLDLGMLERTEGDAEKALPSLLKAATLSPGNPMVYQELGRSYLDLRRFDEAIDALRRAIALAPSAEPPHFFLGRAYRAAGKTSDADQQFAIVGRLLKDKANSETPNADHPSK